MIDPLSKVGRELKAAEEFFELAKNASSPFMRAYYRRVAERYLSCQGEYKPVKRQSDAADAIRTQPGMAPRQMPGPQTAGQKGKVLGV
jgi:hypothetical protein